MSRVNRIVLLFVALLTTVSILATAPGAYGIYLRDWRASPEASTAGSAGQDSVLPPGASENWWGSVQETLPKSEYCITWQERTCLPDTAAAYQAPNRAQNLRTYFMESGIQLVPRAHATPGWNLGLTPTGYGYQENSQPMAAAEMSVEENRVEYRHGELTEWYVNTEAGLEQGFTLHTPPLGSFDAANSEATALVLEFSLSGDLTPALADRGQAIDFVTPGGVRVLRYAGLQVNDAEGNLLDAYLAVSGDGLQISIDASSAVFPITVDPLLTSPSWTVEGNQASAYFGWSVGTAGDVNGDGYADVVVGASAYDGGQTDEGRAYVFYGSAAGLDSADNQTFECDMEYSNFGLSVGTAGDVNGDGYDDVIIGANNYDGDDGINEGAAYVYYGSASGLTYGWKVEGDQQGAELGASVGTAGDVNGDGYADVIVGAQYYDGAYTGEGQAYVFHGSAAGLATAAAWTVDGGSDNATFGCCVSTAGDVNADGYADVIVGAYGFSNVGVGEGKAFVYHGSAGGLSTTPVWSKEGNQSGAWFGKAVSTAGDVNGDSYADVIIGAWSFNNPETDEGVAFVYHGSSSGLSTTQSWFAESDRTGAQLGWSVDAAGDVNGDGYADVIVGVPHYSSVETQEGAACVYHGSADGLSAVPAWSAESNQASARFGCSVGGAGDVNGDGYDDVIVGAYKYDYAETDEGAAFLYYGGGLNNPPVAVDDTSYTTNEDIQLSVADAGVLGNDSDADGHSLTAVKVTDPGHGTVTLNGNGSFTYTPADNYNGSDSFTYKANDGTDDSNVATVNITVNAVNDAPIFTRGANQSVPEDAGAPTASNWATAIRAGLSDESGQTLDFIVTNDNNGLFTVQPAISAAGTLTYTPVPNANGSATVTVSIHDNGGTANGGVDTSGTQTFTISVTAVNDAPSFTTGGNQSVLEDAGAQTVSNWATAISAGPSDESGQTLNFIVTNDNNGLFTVQPAISAAGTLTYTPVPNANGSATVTVTLHDNEGTANGGVDTSATQTFTITATAVNDPPAAADDFYGVHRDTMLNVPAPGVLANDSDVEGGLTAVLVSDVSHGTLTLNANGSFTYTPATGYSGPDSFTYRAYDGSDCSTTVTVTIGVALPEPPTIASITESSGRRGGSLIVTLTGTNLDGATGLDLGAGITVNSLSADNPTQISAELTIASDATLGTRNVVVTTPEGTCTLENAFTVEKAKSGGVLVWIWPVVAVAVLAVGAVGIAFWRRRKARST